MLAVSSDLPRGSGSRPHNYGPEQPRTGTVLLFNFYRSLYVYLRVSTKSKSRHPYNTKLVIKFSIHFFWIMSQIKKFMSHQYFFTESALRPIQSISRDVRIFVSLCVCPSHPRNHTSRRIRDLWLKGVSLILAYL